MVGNHDHAPVTTVKRSASNLSTMLTNAREIAGWLAEWGDEQLPLEAMFEDASHEAFFDGDAVRMHALGDAAAHLLLPACPCPPGPTVLACHPHPHAHPHSPRVLHTAHSRRPRFRSSMTLEWPLMTLDDI